MLHDFDSLHHVGGRAAVVIAAGSMSRLGGGVVTPWRDASERLRHGQEWDAAQHDPQRAGEWLMPALNAIPEPVAICSAIRDGAGGIIDFRIEFANLAACRGYGRDSDSIAGRRLLEVWPQLRDTDIFRAFCETTETGVARSLGEMRVERTVDGQVIPQVSEGTAARVGDGVVTTWRDVTERHRHQEELRALNASLQERTRDLREANAALEAAGRARRELLDNMSHQLQTPLAAIVEANAALEAAGRARREFLDNMSHELRTPLTAILGFSEILLSERAWEVDAATARQYLQRIHNSGAALLKMVDEVLRVAEVASGTQPLVMAPFSLDSALRAELAGTAGAAGARGVTLGQAPARAGTVVGDEEKVKLVLRHLLDNAVKFTPAGGRVWVEVRRRRGAVEVTVADTGIGIAEQDRQHLFQDFSQITSPETGRPPGVGLGLSLVKQLVEMHGGRLRVESTPGQGSRFIFALPPTPPAAAVGGAG